MSTIVLNCHWAQCTEFLMNYSCILISISSSKNSADRPLCHFNYSQNISILTGFIISQGVLHMLSLSLTKYSLSLIVLAILLASLTRIATVIAPAADMQKWIISLYLTDAIANQYLTNPIPLWSCKYELLLYKGLIYILHSPYLHMNILWEYYNQKWLRGEYTRHSPRSTRLVVSEVHIGPARRTTRWLSAEYPALVTSHLKFFT